MEFSHVTVLLDEAISALNIKPDGIYVDATAGGGGHSSEIIKRLTTGKLICIDKDPDAIEVLKKRFEKNTNCTVVNADFTELKNILNGLRIEKIDGILMDLGVSSWQLDCGERGFSYHKDAFLDMRMSKEGTSCYDLVNTLSAEELTRILIKYGEEKFARRIALNIVSQRGKAPIRTTLELAEIVKSSYPAAQRRDAHPARKTFQALRIAVNKETERLEKVLADAFDVLNAGGRIAVITFHSIEDRIVKNEMLRFQKGCICPKDFPVCVCHRTPASKPVYRHPVLPSNEEIENNFRSRSAKLRACEKIHELEK